MATGRLHLPTYKHATSHGLIGCASVSFIIEDVKLGYDVWRTVYKVYKKGEHMKSNVTYIAKKETTMQAVHIKKQYWF